MSVAEEVAAAPAEAIQGNMDKVVTLQQIRLANGLLDRRQLKSNPKPISLK
jgi:hypothetical protein